MRIRVWFALFVLLLATVGLAGTQVAELRRACDNASKSKNSYRWEKVIKLLCKDLGNRTPGAAAKHLKRLVTTAFSDNALSDVSFENPGGPIAVTGAEQGIVARLSFLNDVGEDDVCDIEFRLIWFARRNGHWGFSVLQSGQDLNPVGNKPMDAIIANGRLIIVGHLYEGPVHPMLGANVYRKEAGTWKECQKAEMAWMGDPIRLPRVKGKKLPGPLKMMGRDYPKFLMSGLAGPCTLEETRWRWTGSKYVEVSTKPIMTPLRLLDDMLGWAHNGKTKLIKGRCASARVFAKFLPLAKKVKKETGAYFIGRSDRHFGIEEVGHRFDFAKLHGRWVLSSVRGWKPPADEE